MSAANTVPKLYYGVIEEVIANVRDAFIDEGVDEQTLAELKQIWEKKLVESKAIEREPEPVAPRVVPTVVPTQLVQQQSAHVTSVPVTHQLTMPPANLVPQALLQYSTSSSDGQKTVALNLPQKLTLTVPANLSQAGLQTLMSASPAGTTAVQIPPELASLFQGGPQIPGLPFHTVTIPVTAAQQQVQQNASLMGQMDGTQDTSDEEDEDDFGDNDDDADENDDEQNEEDVADEEDDDPLNSEDDVSDEDPSDLFDTENVVVCQYDKITRSKNRWKFHLKDGIMNLQGKDFVFQKALGDSEW